MLIIVIMLERKIRHKDLQVLLARRVPEDVFLVYVLLLFFHVLNAYMIKPSFLAEDYHTF